MKNKGPDQEYLMKEYTSRINKVLDYIENNLDRSFTLDELARVANFSKFHFHRIFYSFIGETLFQFIQRIFGFPLPRSAFNRNTDQHAHFSLSICRNNFTRIN